MVVPDVRTVNRTKLCSAFGSGLYQNPLSMSSLVTQTCYRHQCRKCFDSLWFIHVAHLCFLSLWFIRSCHDVLLQGEVKSARPAVYLHLLRASGKTSKGYGSTGTTGSKPCGSRVLTYAHVCSSPPKSCARYASQLSCCHIVSQAYQSLLHELAAPSCCIPGSKYLKFTPEPGGDIPSTS